MWFISLLMFSLAAVAAPIHPAAPTTAPTAAVPGSAPISIVVAGAYQPDRVEIPQGQATVLTFTRTTWDGCTREVVFPDLGLRVELPTGVPTPVPLPPLPPGEYVFHCGMKMIRGIVVVK